MMRFEVSTVVGVLCWLRLASPGAAEEVTAGTLHFQFSETGCVTAIATDWADVSAALCHDLESRAGGSEDCRLTAGEREFDPGLLVLELFPSEERGAPAIEVVPRDLSFRGRELETDCGTWSWSLELDKRQAQPVSKLELHPLAVEPANGVTTGVLEISALMRFLNADSGEEVHLPRPLAFDFVVRWALGLPRTFSGTNLYLITDPDGSAGAACLNEVKKCGRWSLIPVERLPDREE